MALTQDNDLISIAARYGEAAGLVATAHTTMIRKRRANPDGDFSNAEAALTQATEDIYTAARAIHGRTVTAADVAASAKTRIDSAANWARQTLGLMTVE